MSWNYYFSCRSIDLVLAQGHCCWFIGDWGRYQCVTAWQAPSPWTALTTSPAHDTMNRCVCVVACVEFSLDVTAGSHTVYQTVYFRSFKYLRSELWLDTPASKQIRAKWDPDMADFLVSRRQQTPRPLLWCGDMVVVSMLLLIITA